MYQECKIKTTTIFSNKFIDVSFVFFFRYYFKYGGNSNNVHNPFGIFKKYNKKPKKVSVTKGVLWQNAGRTTKLKPELSLLKTLNKRVFSKRVVFHSLSYTPSLFSISYKTLPPLYIKEFSSFEDG